MPRPTLSRRTLLRGVVSGAAVRLGLPLLDVMRSAPAEAADASPRRFGVWFWGNGIRREHWIPKETGTTWQAPEELLPLEALRPYYSTLTGLEIKTATHPHHSGMAGILSGAPFFKVGTTRDTIVSTFGVKSIDQVAADHLGGKTPFRSLEVGVCTFRGTDEGTTFQHLSHNGPNNVNPSEYSPPALFRRLFGGASNVQINKARRSVLDAVLGDVRGLNGRVSARDRIRLEQHMESVRSIERRLDTFAMTCKAPGMPSELPDLDGKEQIEQKNQIMSDLVALALACDLTRVFSVMFSTAGSGVVVWQAGARNGLHQICHDEAVPQPTVHAAVVITMKQLAYFLGRLRDTPDGDGNLLDRSAILCTTELSEGNMHSNDEFPILLAGRANGKLKGGLHVRSTTKDNASKALLTVLRAAGVPLTEYGTDGGKVSSTIAAVEG